MYQQHREEGRPQQHRRPGTDDDSRSDLDVHRHGEHDLEVLKGTERDVQRRKTEETAQPEQHHDEGGDEERLESEEAEISESCCRHSERRA